MEPGGSHQHILGCQLTGALLHLTKTDPAPDRQLHRDLEMAAGHPDLPQQLPAEKQGVYICWK